VAASARLGGAAFLGGGGALGLASRAERAIAPRVQKRVVAAAADAAAAMPAPVPEQAEEASENAKNLRIAASVTGWFFLNAVFGAPARPSPARLKNAPAAATAVRARLPVPPCDPIARPFLSSHETKNIPPPATPPPHVAAIMNKKTLTCFPYPWLLSWIQIAVGAAFMVRPAVA